jgi:hypothetical protein
MGDSSSIGSPLMLSTVNLDTFTDNHNTFGLWMEKSFEESWPTSPDSLMSLWT